MNKSICKICEKEFDNDRSFHAHLKAHDIRMVAYYQKYYPRYDLHDEKIIKFKNKNQYFASDFNTRTNLKLWLKDQPKEKAQEYCKNMLSARKEEKGMIYTPSQVELKSMLIPPVQYYDDLFGSYYKLCADMGFKNKYQKITDIVEGAEWNNPTYKIFIDTREQKPLKFKRPVEVRKLNFGDYAFSSAQATCNCYVERKSLSDFVGTLSGGYERFINEIKRAEEDNAYLVVLVESSLSNALNFQRLRHMSNKIKATPEFIFHRVRNLTQRYPFIQFLFVKGRKEASRVVNKIFVSGCIHKKFDLQLAYETKIL